MTSTLIKHKLQMNVFCLPSILLLKPNAETLTLTAGRERTKLIITTIIQNLKLIRKIMGEDQTEELSSYEK